MKKTMSVFLFTVLVFFVVSPFAFAETDEPYVSKKDSFILPAFLERIENSAFEGTAPRVVVFQGRIFSIEDSAFRDARYLSDVYIPSTAEYIGKDAFPSNKRLTIHGVIGSIAAKWAKEHQVSFVPSNIWNMVNDTAGTNHPKSISIDRVYQEIYYERNNRLRGRTEDEGKSMRPQDRPELNPIDYRFP